MQAVQAVQAVQRWAAHEVLALALLPDFVAVDQHADLAGHDREEPVAEVPLLEEDLEAAERDSLEVPAASKLPQTADVIEEHAVLEEAVLCSHRANVSPIATNSGGQWRRGSSPEPGSRHRRARGSRRRGRPGRPWSGWPS